MRTGSDHERRRLERTARFIERGAELTGATGGAAIGLLGGPLGALAGSALGVVLQKTLLRLGDEFEQRHLGPCEQARAGAALYYALTEINERLDDGEEPRDDGFFEADSEHERPRADELLEALLVRAQRDHEERKVKHLGWLYASVVFNEDLSPTDADYLVDLASRLTYYQLVLLSLFHSGVGYRALPGWEELHPYDWRAQALATQLYELCRYGLLARTDRKPVNDHGDASPSHLWVGGMGCTLYHLMRLDQIDEDELDGAYRQMREVADLETPLALVEQLERAVDSAPLNLDDIGQARIRVPLDERAHALLPPRASSVSAELRGSSVTFRVVWPDDDPEYAHLVCLDGDREEFLAVLDIAEGTILRVAPLPDGLRLD